MAEPSEKSPAIEAMLDNVSSTLFGRSRTESISSNICTMCGEDAVDFKDETSKREYTISGLCQACQDKVFSADYDNDSDYDDTDDSSEAWYED